jgi:hypothetical protein
VRLIIEHLTSFVPQASFEPQHEHALKPELNCIHLLIAGPAGLACQSSTALGCASLGRTAAALWVANESARRGIRVDIAAGRIKNYF